MKIKPFGAIGQVPGSGTLCIYEKTATEFLVDCGAIQGGMHSDFANLREFPFNPKRTKFVLLTHGHMDHCGRIPLLYQRGFRGKVICTSETAELAKIQLKDALIRTPILDGALDEKHPSTKIRQAKQKLERILGGMDHWFYEIDRRRTDWHFNKFMPIDDDLAAIFMRSSHMLGAVSIHLLWDIRRNRKNGEDMKSIQFSGDVGNNFEGNCFQSLMHDAHMPELRTRYFVLESTYGDKPDRDPEFEDFDKRLETLRKAVANPQFNTLIFPCFAMQRTQEVLFDLCCLAKSRSLPEGVKRIKIFADSKLAQEISKVYLRALKRRNKKGGTVWRNREMASRLKCGEEEVEGFLKSIFCGCSEEQFEVKYASPSDDASVEEGEKHIIVTSSGMCDQGKVLTHLKRLKERNAAFILTGFQAPGTNGARLLSLAEDRENKVNPEKFGVIEYDLNGDDMQKIEGKDIKAKIFDFSKYYSGHADRKKLLDFLFTVNESGKRHIQAKKRSAAVFLNHGDNNAREKLADEIRKRSAENRKDDVRSISSVELPHANSPFYDLDEGKWIEKESDILGRKLDRVISCIEKLTDKIPRERISRRKNPRRV